MSINPYLKYLGPEDHLQRAVFNYVYMAYPGVLIQHTPNEGRRTKFEQFKMKYLGTKRGTPDVLIFSPSKQFSGLAIELKVGYNKPTPDQKEWLKHLLKCNWHTVWHNTFDDCKLTIDNYFKNNL